MTFTDEIKQSLLKTHKDTNEASLDVYILNTARLFNELNGIIIKKIHKEKPEEFKERMLKPLNKEKNLKWIDEIDKIEKYFDKMKRSISTRRNYYNALLEIGGSMNHPIDAVKQIRNKYADEYESLDSLKSKKQEENFTGCPPKIINDKIDEYEKEIKKGNDKNIKIWMILKLLRELNFRAEEIATLEFVKDYQPDTKRNMVIMDDDGWFISKNKYKTSKKYGESIIPLEGEILRDLKLYHKKFGDGYLFNIARKTKEGDPIPMSSNNLSKLLIRWSNKELPEVVSKDGSKRDRNCSVNMIIKVYQSNKYGKVKKELEKDSKNRGNNPNTMMKHYVSTKKATGFY